MKLSWLRERPLHTAGLALALAAATVVAIAAAYGFGRFGDAWRTIHWGWLAIVAGAELLALPAYAVAYRALAQFENGPELAAPLVLRIVIAGFAPHRVAGGFDLDKRAFHAVEGDEESAKIRVLGLGAVEWALLAPAACVAAAALLIAGDSRPMPSVLWPWVIAVPVGFGIGLALSTPSRLERARRRTGGWRGALYRALRAVGSLHTLIRTPLECWRTWAGMGLYWALDILAFYAALRFVGLAPNAGEAIVAYATGYALTRRSMPLGGAGVTEALMTFALHWTGEPVPIALAAVVVYRVFNLVIPGLLGLIVYPRLHPLVLAERAGRSPALRERRVAAAALRHVRSS